MAFKALRELEHDAGRMHISVAVLAIGDRLMLVLMAGRAVLGCMLGHVLLQGVILPLVAGRAELRIDTAGVGHDLRHMGLMALTTVLGRDVLGMGLVALGALRDLTVHVMAIGAVLGRVLALVFAQLFDLVRMAGETGLGHGPVKGDLERRMRVLVALQAVLLLEVRLAAMAFAADRDVVLGSRTVRRMAVLAVDGGLVFRAVRLDIGRLRCVAFHAVGGGQGRLLRLVGCMGRRGKRKCDQQCEKRQQDFYGHVQSSFSI